MKPDVAGGTHDGREHLLGVGVSLRVRLPPHTLRMTTAGRMACSARQLVASIDGSRRKRNTAGNSLARCLAKRLASFNGGGASIISRPSRASSRPRSESRPCRVSSPFRQRSRTVEAGLEDGLDRRAPRAVGVLLLQQADEAAGNAQLSEEEAFIVTVVGALRSARYRRRGEPLPPTLRDPP